jgi:hypothetical protein
MLLLIFFAGGKKFAQNYMLARELGSGAFSVVKLAMHLVCFFLLSCLFRRLTNLGCVCFVGDRPESSGKDCFKKEIK